MPCPGSRHRSGRRAPARMPPFRESAIPVPAGEGRESRMPGGGVSAAERAAELYRTFGPAVYRRCLKLLRDREAARDATQEVFVKLLADPERFDEVEAALP